MNQVVIQLDDVSVRFHLDMQKKRSIREYCRGILSRENQFQEFYALSHVSMTVRSGESWGVIGANGAGKSTMLKLIAGILKPYQGRVTVRGSVAPLLELGAGFDLNLTGRENIMMNGLILGMTKQEIRACFDEIVDFAELEQFLDVPLRNYSSGMKSRLGFSIATAMKPDILIADEVLSTGDRAFQHKCEARMKRLLDGGTTLLFVSHSLASIGRVCDHALWLDHGQVRMQGEMKAVCDAYAAVADARQREV